MPYRRLVSEELAHIMGILAHPIRIRLIEELGQESLDVGTISKKIGLPQATVSQHLSLLRNNRLVKPQRLGRKVHYMLAHEWLASWLLEGLKLFEEDCLTTHEIKIAAKKAIKCWS